MAMAHLQSKLRGFFSGDVKWFIGLFFIVVLSIVLKVRLAYQTNAFADYDEYYTLKVAFGTFEGAAKQDSISHLWENAELDNGNNVLYNFIAQIMVIFLGKDQMILRWFSFFCHFLSLGLLVSVLWKRQVGKKWILIGIFLFTFFPVIHQFSIITRAYSFLLLEGMFIYWIIYEREKRDSFYLWALSCSLIAAMLTHYLAAIFIVAIFFHTWFVQKRFGWISKEIIPFVFSGLVLILYFIGNIDWFLNIGDKSNVIKETVNAQNVMSYRKFSTEMFVQQGFSFLSKMTTGSQYTSRLAQGIYPGIGQLLFDALSAVFVLLLMIFGLRKKWIKSKISLYHVGLLFPFLMSVMAQHLTSFSMKYSIVFVGWYCILLIIYVHEIRTFRLVIWINTMNIAMNVITYVNYSSSQKLILTVDGVEENYSYSELDVLRGRLVNSTAAEGYLDYHDPKEAEFLKTLMPDNWVLFKLRKVEASGLVTLPRLK
jgi:hypothetical protein